MTLSATLVQVLADANGDLARRLSTRGRWLGRRLGWPSLPPVGRASGEAGAGVSHRRRVAGSERPSGAAT